MSESFSVCKAASGSQQASAENAAFAALRQSRGALVPLFARVGPEKALKLPSFGVVSPAGNRVGKEVRSDKSHGPLSWSQAENGNLQVFLCWAAVRA